MKKIFMVYNPASSFQTVYSGYTTIPGGEVLYKPSLAANSILFRFTFFIRGQSVDHLQYVTFMSGRVGSDDVIYTDHYQWTNCFGYITIDTMLKSWNGEDTMFVKGKTRWGDNSTSPVIHDSYFRDGQYGSWLMPAMIEIVEI